MIDKSTIIQKSNSSASSSEKIIKRNSVSSNTNPQQKRDKDRANTHIQREPAKKRKKKSEWQKQIVQIQRVSKVVKGGKKLSFRTIIIMGNKKDTVGVGVGKADEVGSAIQKAVNDANKNLIIIPITQNKSIPHVINGSNGATKVFIKPASSGVGVIAGSSIRVVLELAGIKNILAKQLGAKNLLNNARATIAALQSLKTTNMIAEERNISLEKLQNYLKYK